MGKIEKSFDPLGNHMEHLQDLIEAEEWQQYAIGHPDNPKPGFLLSEAVILIPLDEANRRLKEAAIKREED